MDDDIRDRFRGVNRQRHVPINRPVPARPVRSHRPAPSVPIMPAQQTKTDTALHKKSTPVKKRKSHKKRRLNKKLLIAFIAILLVCAGLWAGYNRYKQLKQTNNLPAKTATTTTLEQKIAEPPTGTIRFIATGDNLAFESINNAAKKADGSYDYLPILINLKPFYDKADIKVCNESTPAGGEGIGISTYPNFNAPTAWSAGFAGLGCNVINLASNHINDKGQAAIDATLGTWDQKPGILAIDGANRNDSEKSKIKYFTVKGVKFAYLSYTTTSNNKQLTPYGVDIYSEQLANSQIAEANKNSSFVIVSMNWGTENNAEITPEQEQVANNLAAQNVSVVLGTGPHVVQPSKILPGKDGHQTLVWFSLGNLINSQLPIENLVGGMAIMDIEASTRNIKDPKFLPIYMHYEWTAQQKAAGTLNARHDFKLFPLDQAKEALARSQNSTTVEAQTNRIIAIITKFAPIKVITSTEF